MMLPLIRDISPSTVGIAFIGRACSRRVSQKTQGCISTSAKRFVYHYSCRSMQNTQGFTTSLITVRIYSKGKVYASCSSLRGSQALSLLHLLPRYYQGA